MEAQEMVVLRRYGSACSGNSLRRYGGEALDEKHRLSFCGRVELTAQTAGITEVAVGRKNAVTDPEPRVSSMTFCSDHQERTSASDAARLKANILATGPPKRDSKPLGLWNFGAFLL
mmetsp:Transcript_28595/g.78610  ORF Transcript_28595/g.78610 Transcript_28595/m.78610 type:complete len:117 (-) Transcript_28595:594-944(-)